MRQVERKPLTRSVRALRLFALSRIPRCGPCPRYRVFLEAHRHGTSSPAPLPEIPASCTYQVCAPLARAHFADRSWPRGAQVARMGGR